MIISCKASKLAVRSSVTFIYSANASVLVLRVWHQLFKRLFKYRVKIVLTQKYHTWSQKQFHNLGCKLPENSCCSVFVLYNAMSWKKVMDFGENPSFHHLHKKRASNYSFPVIIFNLHLLTLVRLVGFCREF